MRLFWILGLVSLLLAGCAGAQAAAAPLPAAIPSAAAAAAPLPAPSPTAPAPGAFPIRAAFYYPWFPQSWSQQGMDPFSLYQPSLGFYSQDRAEVIRNQIAAMQYGRIRLGIASWWGQGHYTDGRIPELLKYGEQAGFHWALYYEAESLGDPSPEAIRADLQYIRERYAGSDAYLKIDGRFVVFVYADENDGCGMVDRWQQANTLGAYLVLKIFPGYRSCLSQPDSWHQYAPASAQKAVGNDSFTISPGFWKANETEPMLVRDLDRWNADIRAMIASKADFQLITSFNEWGEGTAVESAREWESPSGFGVYLDALHNDGSPPKSRDLGQLPAEPTAASSGSN